VVAGVPGRNQPVDVVAASSTRPIGDALSVRIPQEDPLQSEKRLAGARGRLHIRSFGG
jgi:hypothetical protein